MPDTHGLVVRVSKGLGMVAGGIHEGLGAEQHSGDATIFKCQHIVHTARHARASIADRCHYEVTAFGQLVDDGGLGDARIDEFGPVQGLGHAILGSQSRGDVFQ